MQQKKPRQANKGVRSLIFGRTETECGIPMFWKGQINERR
jgi:hypothetical protein